MSKEKPKKDKSEDNNDEEDYLDKIWENWASRRRCEKRHIPNYIKEKKED